MSLKIGDKIPAVLGKNQDGKEIKSADFIGKKLAVYFYPKDNTPGCTSQACSLRDNYAQLQKAGYEVLGVSTDNEKSHRRFIEKHSLPFDLIADTDKTAVEAFGVRGQKILFGTPRLGTLRTTFLVDENGVITHIFYPKEINTKTHAEQILASK